MSEGPTVSLFDEAGMDLSEHPAPPPPRTPPDLPRKLQPGQITTMELFRRLQDPTATACQVRPAAPGWSEQGWVTVSEVRTVKSPPPGCATHIIIGSGRNIYSKPDSTWEVRE